MADLAVPVEEHPKNHKTTGCSTRIGPEVVQFGGYLILAGKEL